MTHAGRVRPYGRAWVPAATGREAGDFDRMAIDELGVPQATLMENAGRATALVVQRLHPRGRVVGVVGAGNNGGDTLVALRSLAEWGRPVAAVLVADRAAAEPLLHGWPLERWPDAELGEGGRGLLASAGVVLDGILGTGLRGEPRPRQAEASRRVNACGRPVVALDIPSGVDADQGTVPGDAVRAELTVALGFPKLGTLLHPGRAHAGRLVSVDIGFPPVPEGRFTARLITPGWAALLHPSRPPDTHKKAVGVVLVLAGRTGMAGAAVLATRAALRAGAGLVRVASVPENRLVLQTAAPAAVFLDAHEPEALVDALADTSAVVAGPGLGTDPEAAAALAAVLERSQAPLLLDADALNLAALGRTPSLAEIARARPLLVTPHPGEMKRISRLSDEDLGAGRVAAARRWAEETGCVLLLKGAPSLVASPRRPVLVDTVSSSDLATGGMGDVLAGAAAAFLAQGLPPVTAAALALHTSGRAARLARRGHGLLPDDVVERLPDALREQGDGETDLPWPFVQLDQDPVG